MNETDQPAWTLGLRDVPAGLSARRAWRWCVLRTLRDARLAKDKGRPLAAHHLARLLARRWAGMMGEMPAHHRRMVLNEFNQLDNRRFLRKL